MIGTICRNGITKPAAKTPDSNGPITIVRFQPRIGPRGVRSLRMARRRPFSRGLRAIVTAGNRPACGRSDLATSRIRSAYSGASKPWANTKSSAARSLSCSNSARSAQTSGLNQYTALTARKPIDVAQSRRRMCASSCRTTDRNCASAQDSDSCGSAIRGFVTPHVIGGSPSGQRKMRRARAVRPLTRSTKAWGAGSRPRSTLRNRARTTATRTSRRAAITTQHQPHPREIPALAGSSLVEVKDGFTRTSVLPIAIGRRGRSAIASGNTANATIVIASTFARAWADERMSANRTISPRLARMTDRTASSTTNAFMMAFGSF